MAVMPAAGPRPPRRAAWLLPPLLAAIVAIVAACAPGGSRAPDSSTNQGTSMAPDSNGLVKEDLKVGTGPAVAKGQVASVHYTGWLYSDGAPDRKGRKFDSSRDRGQPFEFPVGGGQVIKGWDLGVAGMQVGGQRRLTIPADLGYGARGAGGVIPGGATLVFDVELMAIK